MQSDLDEDQTVDFVTVLTLADGYRWVELKTANALEFEGHYMRNCLGSDRYIQSLSSPTRRYYSLRDPRNRPHVTMMTVRNRIVECKGKANTRPAERYVPAIREFITSLGFILLAAI